MKEDDCFITEKWGCITIKKIEDKGPVIHFYSEKMMRMIIIKSGDERAELRHQLSHYALIDAF